jgi:hypothetical protein
MQADIPLGMSHSLPNYWRIVKLLKELYFGSMEFGEPYLKEECE